MSTEQTAFPLSWPVGRPRTPHHQIKTSAFGKHSLAEARDAVIRELQMLRAGRIIISSNVPLRRDGLMSGNSASIGDSGVAVYFQLKERAMVFACDRWTKVEHNLWAIACTIGAQRGVTRWGSVETEQAFSSYLALPKRAESASCWELLGIRAGSPREHIVAAYHHQAKKLHPDAGGTGVEMALLNEAYATALKGAA